MISKSRESSNFFQFFSYWSRIGLSQYGLEPYRFRRYCIGKYRGHIGLVDIVLVKYRGHIGLVNFFEKFFSKKNAHFWPKITIFGQKMIKNGHFWPKNGQNIDFFSKILPSRPKIGLLIILVLGRIFGAIFYIVLVWIKFLAQK